jgi:hypothetical protein
MNADRYERLEVLFHEALGLAEEQRTTFLANLDTEDLDLEHDLCELLGANKGPA